MEQRPAFQVPCDKPGIPYFKQWRGLPYESLLVLMLLLIPHSPLFSQTLTVVSDLQFPATVSANSMQYIVVSPSDSGAAVFDAIGSANQTVEVTVKENSIKIQTPTGIKLKVDNFTYGGSLTPVAKGAIGTFDANGDLFNMRIGATARVKKDQESGIYSGTLTLQVIYQ
jgi:hypothetical protein